LCPYLDGLSFKASFEGMNTMSKTTYKNANTQQNNIEVYFASHSGGKDSQAMLAKLIDLGLKDKIVLVHSDLGEMEWEPMHHWIKTNSFGLPVHVVKANESFIELCERTGRLPSGNKQYCTDILKTKPINEFIHNYMTEHGIKVAANVTGMRAEESKRRAAKSAFSLSKGKKTSGMHMPKKFPGHTVYDWHPIFDYNTVEVFAAIASAGQAPHELYSMGFSRLSCVFCVNGRVEEHQRAAELRPELALKIANLERKLGKAYRLKQVNNVKYPKFMDTYIRALPPQFAGAN
jgi:DNA sulfur modification protein DndC